MKTLMELEPNDCRYVVDDEHNFCGAPKHVYWVNGVGFRQSAYCAEHHPLCYRPFVEKKERVA